MFTVEILEARDCPSFVSSPPDWHHLLVRGADSMVAEARPFAGILAHIKERVHVFFHSGDLPPLQPPAPVPESIAIVQPYWVSSPDTPPEQAAYTQQPEFVEQTIAAAGGTLHLVPGQLTNDPDLAELRGTEADHYAGLTTNLTAYVVAGAGQDTVLHEAGHQFADCYQVVYGIRPDESAEWLAISDWYYGTSGSGLARGAETFADSYAAFVQDREQPAEVVAFWQWLTAGPLV